MTNPFDDDNETYEEPYEKHEEHVPADSGLKKDKEPETQPVREAGDPAALTVTIKAGAGYDAPWLVQRAATASTMYRQLSDPVFKDVIDLTAKIGHYAAKAFGGGSAPASGGQAKSAEGPKEAPGGEKRFCKHGEMKFDTKVSRKTNKPYSAFFCQGPREDSCGIEFPGK